MMNATLLFAVLSSINILGDVGQKNKPVDPKEWGQSLNGFQLAVFVTKETFETNEPVSVVLVISNITDHAFSIGKADANICYKFTVLDIAGKQVPMTSFGEHSQRFIEGSWVVPFTLKGHETDKSQFELSKFYDVSKPGKYSLFVSRRVPVFSTEATGAEPKQTAHYTNIISNTLEFSVRAAKGFAPL